MCDMTQFILIILMSDIHAHTLARFFMQNILLKIDVCVTVVDDDGNSFKDLLKAMCIALNI